MQTHYSIYSTKVCCISEKTGNWRKAFLVWQDSLNMLSSARADARTGFPDRDLEV